MLKDERLAHLSTRYNVARFSSFRPGDARLRYRVTDDDLMVDASGEIRLEQAIRELLDRSRSVNVRTFLDRDSKNTEFLYGLTSIEEAVAAVRRLAEAGFYTIVNETIDVNDGGVSGVSLGGVTEFAPGATPRVVEATDGRVARLPTQVAEAVLSTVYGIRAAVASEGDERLEFSVHPTRVGHRHEHTLYWEVAAAPKVDLQVLPTWPNDFSRFLGDKLYGLLLADAFGLPVPRATAIGRRFKPFSFGTATGTGEVWTRTSPATATPGFFTTVKGWVDPFELLAKEDPMGAVASVLAQESVHATYSGGAISQHGGPPVVEGVAGAGDDFMLGTTPQPLPSEVHRDVEDLLKSAQRVFGPIQMEWVHDGRSPWLVQVHSRAITALAPSVLSPGEPSTWIEFDPNEGLEALRHTVKEASLVAAGIVLLRPVGITSHFGDVLRAAGVPGRLAH